MKIFVTILLIVLSSQSLNAGQSLQQMDAQMAYFMDRLSYWYLHADETMGGADSLENNNDLFIEYLEKTVIQHDSSLVADFPLAQKSGLNIATSPDGKMRLFAWDRKDDPDKQHIENIAAYMTYYDVRYTDVATLEKKGTPCYFYESLTPVRTGDGTAFIATYRRSSPRRLEGVRAYGIVNHKLAKVPVFKDKTGTYSELSYDYVPDSMSNKTLLHLSENNDKLYVPVINDDIFTGKFTVYSFDGYKFVEEKKAR